MKIYKLDKGQCNKCLSNAILYSQLEDGRGIESMTTSNYEWRDICLKCIKKVFKFYLIKIVDKK